MPFDRLNATILPLRHALLDHPIYREMNDASALRTFMEHHVFAVWDFMSLLKALQRRLCCVSVPWVPAPDSFNCRFINEIVLGEESDDDGHGGYASHFELYRRAMNAFGAETSRMDQFLSALTRGSDLPTALRLAEVGEPVQRFVMHTFDVIESGDVCRIASAFTFGREDLLPDVFGRIVEQISEQSGNRLDDFIFYLRRHMELDGESHGPMATRLVSSLCDNTESKWCAAEDSAVAALTARLDLWNGIHAAIKGSDTIA